MKKKNKYIQPLIVTVILEDDAGGGLMAAESGAISGGGGGNGDGNTGNGETPPSDGNFSAKSGFGSGFSLFDDDDLESDY